MSYYRSRKLGQTSNIILRLLVKILLDHLVHLCLHPKRASERTVRRREVWHIPARMISSPDSRNRRVTKSGFTLLLLLEKRAPVVPPGPTRRSAPPSLRPARRTAVNGCLKSEHFPAKIFKRSGSKPITDPSRKRDRLQHHWYRAYFRALFWVAPFFSILNSRVIRDGIPHNKGQNVTNY